jgi:hypothetical protein
MPWSVDGASGRESSLVAILRFPGNRFQGHWRIHAGPDGFRASLHFSREGPWPIDALKRRYLTTARELDQCLDQLDREGWQPLQTICHNLAPTLPG